MKCRVCGQEVLPMSAFETQDGDLYMDYHARCFEDALEDYEEKRRERLIEEAEY